MRGGDEDCATGVSSLANEEPLVGMKSGIDIVREIIGEDSCDSSDCVVGEREASLCRGGYGFGGKGSSRAKDGDIGCRGSVDSHWRSEIFSSRGGDIDVVGVDSDIVIKRGKKEGVEYFLSYAGGCRRHGRWRKDN